MTAGDNERRKDLLCEQEGMTVKKIRKPLVCLQNRWYCSKRYYLPLWNQNQGSGRWNNRMEEKLAERTSERRREVVRVGVDGVEFTPVLMERQ